MNDLAEGSTIPPETVRNDHEQMNVVATGIVSDQINYRAIALILVEPA